MRPHCWGLTQTQKVTSKRMMRYALVSVRRNLLADEFPSGGARALCLCTYIRDILTQLGALSTNPRRPQLPPVLNLR